MGRHVVELQSGYMLHRYPYKESSLLVDMFTRGHGRVMLIAKGARRKQSPSRGLFMPFKPLLVSWSGRGSLPTLTGIEYRNISPDLDRLGRSCGYYSNELLMQLLHRQDSHEALFDRYESMLAALLRGDDPSPVLRVFEKHLLQETGFGLMLDREADTGAAIREDALYSYIPQKGPVLPAVPNQLSVSGKTLIALHNESFTASDAQREARLLTRMLINVQLNGRALRTRRVVRSMRRFQQSLCSESSAKPSETEKVIPPLSSE